MYDRMGMLGLHLPYYRSGEISFDRWVEVKDATRCCISSSCEYDHFDRFVWSITLNNVKWVKGR